MLEPAALLPLRPVETLILTVRLLVRVYPRAFRERYAPAMLAFAMERFAEAAHRGESRVRVWTRTVADLAASAALEWLRVLRSDDGPAVVTAASRQLSAEEHMSILTQEIALA